jgi:hypothetical protein
MYAVSITIRSQEGNSPPRQRTYRASNMIPNTTTRSLPSPLGHNNYEDTNPFGREGKHANDLKLTVKDVMALDPFQSMFSDFARVMQELDMDVPMMPMMPMIDPQPRSLPSNRPITMSSRSPLATLFGSFAEPLLSMTRVTQSTPPQRVGSVTMCGSHVCRVFHVLY